MISISKNSKQWWGYLDTDGVYHAKGFNSFYEIRDRYAEGNCVIAAGPYKAKSKADAMRIIKMFKI